MAHGGYRVPKLGRHVKRNERGLNHRYEECLPSVVFMVQDRVERALAHDTDAYRVRRMFDSRDLWTVVPDQEMHASTEFEREYFEDISRIQPVAQSKRQYLGAMLSRRSQIKRAHGMRSAKMSRVMGRD
jgi:hypothetical protein